MRKEEYLTIPQLAKMLGISRIAVYRKVRKGQIKAEKIGRSYAIARKQIPGFVGRDLTKKDKLLIMEAVQKAIQDFGEALRLLGRE